eukprot:COSAG04_NODE_3198_length_3061_cov_25.008778_2_plen_146_part_00
MRGTGVRSSCCVCAAARAAAAAGTATPRSPTAIYLRPKQQRSFASNSMNLNYHNLRSIQFKLIHAARIRETMSAPLSTRARCAFSEFDFCASGITARFSASCAQNRSMNAENGSRKMPHRRAPNSRPGGAGDQVIPTPSRVLDRI